MEQERKRDRFPDEKHIDDLEEDKKTNSGMKSRQKAIYDRIKAKLQGTESDIIPNLITVDRWKNLN